MNEVRVSHVFDVPRELVFAAWTDPRQVASWWAPPGFEIPLESVEIEPRAGGRFHLTMVGGGDSFPYRSEFVEISPPELIVLKAEAIPEAGIAETFTRIAFEAEGQRTRMTITSGPYTDDVRDNAEAGWIALFANLEAALGRGDETARAIVDANSYMVLGTADEAGRPWVSPVWYAPAGYSEFIWVSRPEARHSLNIRARPELSIVIFDSTVPIDTGQAVYMAATARQLPVDEWAAALETFNSRSLERGGREWSVDDVQAPAELRLYAARATDHWIIDGSHRIPVTL